MLERLKVAEDKPGLMGLRRYSRVQPQEHCTLEEKGGFKDCRQRRIAGE